MFKPFLFHINIFKNILPRFTRGYFAVNMREDARIVVIRKRISVTA